MLIDALVVVHTDINECENAIGGCNHVCTNTIGSFLCSCNAGYELDSDQRTCVGEYNTTTTHFIVVIEWLKL